jgi:tetratricopeptide (TPR) repeat protein
VEFQPARPEDIAQACAALAALTPLPEKILGGLAANDVDALRSAVTHLIDAHRWRGLREIIAIFRPTRDLGVFARVQSSRLHRLDGDFAAALGDLEEVTALFPQRAAPHWWVGRALCLDALGRVAEAEAVAREGAARFPENLQATAFVAQWLGRRGRWREASALWDEMFARFDADFPESKPDWWADSARARHELGQDEAAEAALAQLERRFSASPLAARERLRNMRDREYGAEPIRAQLADALGKFPDEPEFRALNVTILLSEGRLKEAEAEAAALEEGSDREAALSARLRVEEDRGERHLRAFAEGFVARVATVGEALRAVASLLGARAPWAFDIAERVLARAAEFEPGNIRLTVGRARVMIAQLRDEEALAAIDALPTHHQRRDYLELRAWAHVKRGQDAQAKSLWDEALGSVYFPAVHGPVGDMKRISPDDRPPPGEGVTAYVVLRNEAAQIPAFLDHHRRLGVRRFVFCDHLSTDESRALALSQPDVVVYDCPGSYQLTWSGRRWINEIVAREGAMGWGLQLDIDEHLVYPGCERVNVDRFVGYLDAHGFEGVRGYMLDVFPARLIGADGRPAPLSEYRWFDDDYYLFGQPRPPYLQPGGGVRARLFEAKEFLHKIPLWRLDAGKLLSSHETTHLRFADVSAALKHYKLMNVALRGRGVTPQQAGRLFLEADSDTDAIRRHVRYAARLDRLWNADLVEPGLSREIGDSLDMTARGLMTASPAYLGWLGA